MWTVQEYHRMVEVGILQPDEPVELVAGQILQKMSPQGKPHATAITRAERILRLGLGGIVEVADTTLKRDCQLKANDYASSGIQDYWVLDLNNRCLHLFREPTEEGYINERRVL